MSANQKSESESKSEPEVSLVCDVCGKSFDSEVSLRGHKLRAHRLSSSKTSSFIEEGGKPSIPDPYAHLKQMLTTFGLSDRDAGAVVKFMEPYSPDDIHKLIEAASTYMPKGRLRLFIESWSNVRGIPIPPDVEEELGISIPYDYAQHRRYDYYAKRPKYEGEGESSSSALVEMIKGLTGITRALMEKQLSPPPSNPEPNSPLRKLESLEDELKETKAKLEEERMKREEMERKRVEEEIETLKREIMELKNKPIDATLKKLDILDRRLADLSECFKLIVKSSITSEKPPKREESPSSELTEEELKSLGIPYEEV